MPQIFIKKYYGIDANTEITELHFKVSSFKKKRLATPKIVVPPSLSYGKENSQKCQRIKTAASF